MSIISLISIYLRAKWPSTTLHILLMMLGVLMVTALLLFTHQMNDRLYRYGAGIDVVVGAKGSALQLIMSSIYHVDIPVGNISMEDVDAVKQHPYVKKVIPISLGDSYSNFRIVGTEISYLKHFNVDFLEGNSWDSSMQVVIGSTVARKTGMTVGSSFAGVHGLSMRGHKHTESLYRVVGVMKPTGNVLDRLILTSLDSVWNLHSRSEHSVEEPKEVTSLLIRYSNRAASLSFPSYINKNTTMQAASPSFEIARLVDMIGVGENAVMILSIIIVSISLLSIFIGLLNSVCERCYDIAVFRVIGASRKKIIQLVVGEGISIAFIGSVLGLLLGHGMVEIIGNFSHKGIELGLEGFIFVYKIWFLWLFLLFISLVICLIPAWYAYKVDIRDTLNSIH